MLTLTTPLNQLPKVGPAYLKKLHKLGLHTIEDLLLYFPYRYNDFSQVTPIIELEIGQTATIQAEVLDVKNIRTFRRKMNITNVLAQDDSGTIQITWFNQPYIAKILRPGTKANFSGKISAKSNNLQLTNPIHEVIKDDEEDLTHTGRLIPIYHETEGVTSRYLRYLIKSVFHLADQIQDWLADDLKKEFNLLNLTEAIKQVHFPENEFQIKKARYRLGFDEFYLIQLIILRQKAKLQQKKAPTIPFEKDLIKAFVETLPFQLTDCQRLAAWEIFQDMKKERPMNRLLNGDVGSGKTIVATLAGLAAIKAGYQVALMAPTEILAKQHFENISQMLKPFKIKTALLTSSEQALGKENVSKEKIQKSINQRDPLFVIGTHSLIEKKLSFKKLALAIIDEQHRFGTQQRSALVQKGNKSLHLLSMSATPIPRTLALTVYGDLDVSLIKTMPRGRKITTKIIKPEDRQKTYDFIRQQVEKKKGVFIICPLIDDSEKMEAKSVNQEHEKISLEIFPEFSCAALHGKIKPTEKERTINDFKDGKTDILISTSVIEVGVDIPHATIMIIEGADRFGLSQLHQFRGRIGRSGEKAYCFLFTESESNKTTERLEALTKTENGFQLAEKDLELRGPGSITGVRQWGLPDLKIAAFNDLDLIKKTRQAAKETYLNRLFTPLLLKKIQSFKKEVHLE